eukprot:9576309-Alexandrium_andersonii.AAC.1
MQHVHAGLQWLRRALLACRASMLLRLHRSPVEKHACVRARAHACVRACVGARVRDRDRDGRAD